MADGNNTVLNYQESYYAQKVESLNEYANILQGHKDTINDLATQLFAIWEGEGASEMLQTVTETMSNLQHQIDLCNLFAVQYQETAKSANALGSTLTSTIDTGVSVLTGLDGSIKA